MSKYIEGTKVKVEFPKSVFKYGTVLNSVDSPYIKSPIEVKGSKLALLPLLLQPLVSCSGW